MDYINAWSREVVYNPWSREGVSILSNGVEREYINP